MASHWRHLILVEVISLLGSALFLLIVGGLAIDATSTGRIIVTKETLAFSGILHSSMMAFVGLLIATVTLLIGPFSRGEIEPGHRRIEADVDYWWPFLVSIVWSLLGAILAGVSVAFAANMDPQRFAVLFFLMTTAAFNTLWGFARVVFRLWSAVHTMILTKHEDQALKP